jgi:hypothetical protein
MILMGLFAGASASFCGSKSGGTFWGWAGTWIYVLFSAVLTISLIGIILTLFMDRETSLDLQDLLVIGLTAAFMIPYEAVWQALLLARPYASLPK